MDGKAPLDAQYLVQLRREFPKLRLLAKGDSLLCHAIDVALRIVTFGGQRRFLDGYVTTLGQRIYVPDGWAQRSAEDRTVVLRHEAVHLRQFRRYTFLGMALLYLTPILPLGLALGRALLEREAYRETLRAIAEIHGPQAVTDEVRARIVRQFTSAAYGWMWPFPKTLARWFDIEKLSR